MGPSMFFRGERGGKGKRRGDNMNKFIIYIYIYIYINNIV